MVPMIYTLEPGRVLVRDGWKIVQREGNLFYLIKDGRHTAYRVYANVAKLLLKGEAPTKEEKHQWRVTFYIDDNIHSTTVHVLGYDLNEALQNIKGIYAGMALFFEAAQCTD